MGYLAVLMASMSFPANGGVPSDSETKQNPSTERSLTDRAETKDGFQANLENSYSRSNPSASHVDSGNKSTSGVPAPVTVLRPVSPAPSTSLSPTRSSVSPHRARQLYMPPSSPGRPLHSPSRLHSPASSQIFERDVQENIIPAQSSPAIPTHIMTENHIPPILEASSAALTDGKLDPDSVEIVTHNSHHPASLNVTGGAVPSEHQMVSSWYEDVNHQTLGDMEDSSSAHEPLDSTDIRRLSFISFADVVHGEHAETVECASNGNPLAGGGILKFPGVPASPIRSPVSSRGAGTSPRSLSPIPGGLGTSTGIRGPSSPPHHPHSPSASAVGPELNVETMTQTLRRTESGEFGGLRSLPLSAIGSGDGSDERSFK